MKNAAKIPAGLAQPWLAMQCSLVAGVSQAVLALDGEEQTRDGGPAACWPNGTACSAELSATVAAARSRGRAVIRNSAEPGSGGVVALPIRVDGELAGAVALRLASQSADQLNNAMQLLKWGAGWLEFLARQQAGTVNTGMATMIELVATCLQHRQFQPTASALVTELANQLGCESVALGTLDRGRIRLKAMSNSAWIDAGATLSRRLEQAMCEAVDQRAMLVFPVPRDAPLRVTQAHAALAAQQDGSAYCTVPMLMDRRITGALLLHRAGGQPFDEASVALCEHIAAVVGPILELKRLNDRSWLRKNADAMRSGLQKLFGAGHLTAKLTTVAGAALLAFLALANGTYRVTAAATLEGAVQRVVVAPANGFVAEATARPGDVVGAGEALGSLDASTLILEQTKWASKKEQLAREYRNALAAHDRVQASILKAQMDQAGAELELVTEQLQRVKLVAPFAGVVVAGDLSQSLGSPVERGDILFKIAPLDAYRLILQVDEHDIAQLAVGQVGNLVLSALSGQYLAFTVDRITPVATSEDGGNFFQVEARLEQSPGSLRPGMEGIAKVEIEQRRLLWIWSHKLTQGLALWLWSWWN